MGAFTAHPSLQLLLQPHIKTFGKAEYKVLLSGDSAGVVYPPFYAPSETGSIFCQPGHMFSELWHSDGTAIPEKGENPCVATSPMPQLYDNLVNFALNARNQFSQDGDTEVFATAFARVDVLVLHKYHAKPRSGEVNPARL